MKEPQLGVSLTAQDRSTGMTLGELETFVEYAKRAGTDPSTRIRVHNGFRQQIVKLEIR